MKLVPGFIDLTNRLSRHCKNLLTKYDENLELHTPKVKDDALRVDLIRICSTLKNLKSNIRKNYPSLVASLKSVDITNGEEDILGRITPKTLTKPLSILGDILIKLRCKIAFENLFAKFCEGKAKARMELGIKGLEKFSYLVDDIVEMIIKFLVKNPDKKSLYEEDIRNYERKMSQLITEAN